MYGYPASGYVMSAGGAPVAIPMQAMQAGASGAAAPVSYTHLTLPTIYSV